MSFYASKVFGPGPDKHQIFSDKSVTIEDIMREKGELVKRGSLNSEGDIEMWPEEPGNIPRG